MPIKVRAGDLLRQGAAAGAVGRGQSSERSCICRPKRQRPDASFDLWSVTMVRYECLAGSHSMPVPNVFEALVRWGGR